MPVRAESRAPRRLSAALCPSCMVLVSCCRAQIASAPAPSDGFSNSLTQSSLHPQVLRDNTKVFSVFHYSCLESGDTTISPFCLEGQISSQYQEHLSLWRFSSSAVHQGRHRAGLQRLMSVRHLECMDYGGSRHRELWQCVTLWPCCSEIEETLLSSVSTRDRVNNLKS